MFKKIILFLAVVSLFSCQNKSKVEQEIESVPIDFELLRFDQKFANAQPNDLPELKQEFPYLFPQQFHDSVWVNQMKDTIQDEINTEVSKAFPNFSEQEDELHKLFQHIKYYFPEFETPTVVTVTSEVDYRNKVIVVDSLLLISLDTYLGADHHFYLGIQNYMSKNFEASQIIPDVATAYAEQWIPRPRSRTLLAHMIYYGKILYLKDLLIPSNPDYEKIGYTQDEINWAKANEEQIWRYLVDRNLLFNTDSQLYNRFLYPAPFTKFYLELDNESPDRLGQYIGWQIVREYMNDNNVSVKQLLQTDAETIFNNANYKPRK